MATPFDLLTLNLYVTVYVAVKSHVAVLGPGCRQCIVFQVVSHITCVYSCKVGGNRPVGGLISRTCLCMHILGVDY